MRFTNAVDTDGHLSESAIPWADRISPKYREMAPQYVRLGGGGKDDPQGSHGGAARGGRTLVEGKLVPKPFGKGRGAGNVIHREGVPGARPGVVDPGERLKDMDAEGIEVATLFGAVMGMGIGGLDDAGLATEISRIYNDWVAEYCSTNRNRLKGVAVLGLQDVGASVLEARRAVEKLDMRVLGLPPNVHGVNLDHPQFNPIYQEAVRLGVPVAVHTGAGIPGVEGAGQERFDNFFFTNLVSHAFEQLIAAACFSAGGVLDRFPKLRVLFCEAGAGWLPFWIERLDLRFERLPHMVPWLSRKPSEYLRGEQCYIACDQQEETLPFVVQFVGENRVTFASDYCHWYGIFPGSVRALAERTDLSDQVKEKVLRTNGLRYLGIA